MTFQATGCGALGLVVLAACTTIGVSPAPTPPRSTVRDGVVWSPRCDRAQFARACASIAAIAQATLERGGGRRIGPAAIVVDHDRATYVIRRRQQTSRAAAGRHYTALVLSGAGAPLDWARLPTLREGRTRNVRFSAVSVALRYRISIRLTPVRGPRGRPVTEALLRLYAIPRPSAS